MKRWFLLGAAVAALTLTCYDVRAEAPAKDAAANDAAPETKKEEAPPAAPSPPPLDKGDIAWMLMSTGLVLLMVPGLALFYGGMVGRKHVLGTMMHSMVALSIVGIQWVLVGYSLAFGDTHGGWIGWSDKFVGLQGVMSNDPFPNTMIPIYLHCMFQGMFAIITPALISGAVAERIKFGPYCLFILLWATLVYDPLAHWVWAVGPVAQPDGSTAIGAVGVLGSRGALDFAGGTVVHIAAGLSALAAILVLRKRSGYPAHTSHPNSMILTLTGAGLLWFGWFGFNGGSALASNGLAVAALTVSQIAAAAAGLSWITAEWLHKGKPTALGLASGIVAGLVVITPASGYVTPVSALIMGLLAGVVCYGAVCLKPILKYDDSLDAFGVHGVGGFLGAVLTGVFASQLLFNRGAGLDDSTALGALADGRAAQIQIQLIAALVAVVYSFVVTIVLVKAIDLVFGFCVDEETEAEGLDRSQHGEVGFDLGLAMEMTPAEASPDPRPASLPPGGKRFSVVVEGVKNGELMHAWSDLCQPSDKGAAPAPEFLAVYPFVTTVQGNRFHFRGGPPEDMKAHLEKLFEKHLKGKVKAHVET